MSNNKTCKYEVGDRVAIKQDLIVGHTYDGGCTFVEGMAKLRGRTVFITDIWFDYRGFARIEISARYGKGFYWSESMFTLVEKKDDINKDSVNYDNLGNKTGCKRGEEESMNCKELLATILQSTKDGLDSAISEKEEINKKIAELMIEKNRLDKYINELASICDRIEAGLDKMENIQE